MNVKIAVAVSALAVLLCSGGSLRAQDAPSAPPPPPPREKPEAAPATKPRPMRIRVGGNVAKAKMIHQVQPIYPEKAKAAHVQGTILLHAVIARDGTIAELQYVSGPEMLMRSSMDAVRQWRYAPTLLNGEPVEVDTTISVVYTLSDGDGAPEDQNQDRIEIDPQLKADILHMLDAMHVTEQMKAMSSTMLHAIRPQLSSTFSKEPDGEKIVDSIGAKLGDLMQSSELMDGIVAIYARYVSDEDVKAITQFYDSVPGQHILAALPHVIPEASQLGQDLVRKHMPDIMKQICREYPSLKNSPDVCPADPDKTSQMVAPSSPAFGGGGGANRGWF
jgi:TonB family protein